MAGRREIFADEIDFDSMTPYHIEDARIEVKNAISSLATIHGLRTGELDKIVLATLNEVKAEAEK